MYDTVTNNVTLFSESLQASPILLLVYNLNDWMQNHCWLSFTSLTPDSTAVVYVYCQSDFTLAVACPIYAFFRGGGGGGGGGCSIIRCYGW